MIGPERKRLYQLLLACHSYDSLKRVLSFMDPAVALAEISADHNNLKTVAADAIDKMHKLERVREFLSGLQDDDDSNATLTKCIGSLGYQSFVRRPETIRTRYVVVENKGVRLSFIWR